jgi:hypothetical protein
MNAKNIAETIIDTFNSGNKGKPFPKGHTPWNKGLKGIHLSPTTEFKKGGHYSVATEFKAGIPSPRKGTSNEGWVNQSSFKKGVLIEDKHPSWLGDAVGYTGVHKWVYRQKGKAIKCEDCFVSNKTYHWHNLSGNYVRDLSDWVQVCAKCHKRRHKK